MPGMANLGILMIIVIMFDFRVCFYQSYCLYSLIISLLQFGEFNGYFTMTKKSLFYDLVNLIATLSLLRFDGG